MLQKALSRVLEPSTRAAASTLGGRVRDEPDATPRIVELVEVMTARRRAIA